MTNFLKEGAFYRHGKNWYLFSEGPVHGLRERTQDIEWPSSDLKSQSWVLPMSFFTHKPNLIWQSKAPLKLDNIQMQNLLQDYLQSSQPVLKQNAGPSLDVSAFLLVGEKQKQQTLSATTYADFSVDFENIQARIQSKKIEKAVPFITEEFEYSPTLSDKAFFLLQLLKSPESLYPYGFWQESQGIVGCSPELLFRQSEALSLQTAALAGTALKHQGKADKDLNQDSKEIEEHMWVVKFLQSTLSPYGDLTKKGPYILDMPHLQHLKTEVDLRLQKPESILKWIELLHPTSALGVYPKTKENMKWFMTLNQQQSRQQFGAPLTFVSEQEVLSLVAIRCLQWDQHSAKINTGCGVIQQSQCEKEWQELLQKRFSVKKMLGWTL
ncbi:MAG: chorismate-binding protein [Pseudobdellovibrionaceae bacterium]